MTPRPDTQQLYAHLSGNGAASLVLDAQEALNGEIVSATWQSTGVYTVVFRYKYPELKEAPACTIITGTTTGIAGNFSAIDITAGTGTLKTTVGNTLTDLGAADIIYISWTVRNSGKNR